MQFITLREPLSGYEHYTRQIAGRWERFSFEYSLGVKPWVEGIAAYFAGTHAMDRYRLELNAGTDEGFKGLQGKGVRLCCIQLALIDPHQHHTGNPDRQLRNALRWFVRECVPPLAVPINPLHRDWLTSDVIALARGIHRGAALDGIPVLHDALLEAGCDDPLVMEHLQTCPDHSPSCWVVEMILNQVHL